MGEPYPHSSTTGGVLSTQLHWESPIHSAPLGEPSPLNSTMGGGESYPLNYTGRALSTQLHYWGSPIHSAPLGEPYPLNSTMGGILFTHPHWESPIHSAPLLGEPYSLNSHHWASTIHSGPLLREPYPALSDPPCPACSPLWQVVQLRYSFLGKLFFPVTKSLQVPTIMLAMNSFKPLIWW